MSFSDKFRDLWDKKKSSDSSANKKEGGSVKSSRPSPDASTPSKTPPLLPPPSPDRGSSEPPAEKDSRDHESQLKSLDKEIHRAWDYFNGKEEWCKAGVEGLKTSGNFLTAKFAKQG